MSRRPSRITVAIVIAVMACLVGGCGRERDDRCAMCAKELPATGGVTLVSAEGQKTRLCCARCSLLYAPRAAAAGSDLVSMRANDFETGEPVELTEAVFVYGSNTVPCCAPSVLVVSDRETAVDLAGHGGGTVMDYAEVRATLVLEAAERCAMCSKSMDLATTRPCVLLEGGGQDYVACCPHCAFMLQGMLRERQPDRSYEIVCTHPDGRLFRLGEESRFVADSDVPMCCRPTLVACDTMECAASVVADRGGSILTVGEAVDRIREAGHSKR